MKRMIPVYVLQVLLIVTCFVVGMKVVQRLDAIDQRMAQTEEIRTRRLAIEPFDPPAVRVKIVEQ